MPVHSAFSRRHALALAVASVVSMAAPAAWAQDSWPTKPITFVVPQNPGGANDVIARAVAQSLENSLGQPVIVENRAGANGNVGTGQVARSAQRARWLYLSGDGAKRTHHQPCAVFAHGV